MVAERTIGMTTTGEIFQPVRLYYKVANRNALKECFDKLQCVQFDASKQRSVWLYDGEAKSIDFRNKFSSIPEKAGPIVIGSLVWKNADTIIVDLRSFERALKAIMFFDKEISRSIAMVTHCAVVNRIFELNESSLSNFDCFFENNEKMAEINPEETMNRMRAASLSIDNMPNFQGIISFLDDEMKRFFEIEKFPAHFYEDGIGSLEASFIVRRTIAMERWNGAANYSYKEAFNKIFKENDIFFATNIAQK